MIRILSSDLPSRSTNITYTTQKMHLIKDPFGEDPKSKAVINKSQTRATERDSPRYSASLSFALICLVYSKASGDYTAKWTGNETGSHISAFKGIPQVIQKLKKEPCSQKKPMFSQCIEINCVQQPTSKSKVNKLGGTHCLLYTTSMLSQCWPDLGIQVKLSLFTEAETDLSDFWDCNCSSSTSIIIF